MASLIASGTVEDDPVAIAKFLREHRSLLDSTQVGEYFGHHEDHAVRPNKLYCGSGNLGCCSLSQGLVKLYRPDSG